MRRHDWSRQVPVRQAIERDEQAVAARKSEVWAQINPRTRPWRLDRVPKAIVHTTLTANLTVFVAIVLLTAARVALPTVVRIAAALAAVIAVVAAARIPDRVRRHLDDLLRGLRVIALDHQLTDARASLGGVILEHDRQARAGVQLRREWIVQELPVTAHAPEVHALHVKRAVAHVADRDVRSAQQPALTPPKVVEPVTASLPAGASPETSTLSGLAGSSLVTVIVADFGPKLAGWKRIGHGQRVARADRDRVREHLRARGTPVNSTRSR